MVDRKKIISFFVVISIITSLFLPVSATGWGQTGIFDWSERDPNGGFDFSSKEEYDSYVQDMNEQLGTTLFGLHDLYIGDWRFGTGTSAVFSLTSGPTFHVTGTPPTSGPAYVGLSIIGSFYAPVSGEYRLKYFDTGTIFSPIVHIMQGETILKNDTVNFFRDGFWLDLEAGTLYTIKLSDTIYRGESVDYTGCVGIEMPSGVPVDLSENSRPGSVTGPIGYYNQDNGNLEVIGDNNTTFVDESNNIYYSPVTDQSINMTDWYYDYSDRSYHITTEDGGNVVVTYGDGNVTINEGGNTYNYYYLAQNAGGGTGGDSGDIGGIVSGLLGVVGDIIGGLIEGALVLATKALEALTGLGDLFAQMITTIPGFFGGFIDFLSAMFPFLPEETITILNLGLILMIAAAVFNKFFK